MEKITEKFSVAWRETNHYETRTADSADDMIVLLAKETKDKGWGDYSPDETKRRYYHRANKTAGPDDNITAMEVFIAMEEVELLTILEGKTAPFPTKKRCCCR